MDVIADLLNSGVDEECIVKGIESWWNNKHPREYLRAIKSKLKLKLNLFSRPPPSPDFYY